eukprot:TRINITY_DN12433_c0_g1::TRINITY_DN12433_c0_g1_i1::g.15124::m.15124 TRINITY_DN12433_c0_g1::TRINITY_DN12433_c0_g1_i1::g.15124  ORF type:complete len:295 (+),score=55.94,sp/P48496/TPIC_SPIOL/54.69/3e-91,TIM/PF00121.13/4.1e-83 TRINITY_DN12433_c0_g1_i1:40-924(+)
MPCAFLSYPTTFNMIRPLSFTARHCSTTLRSFATAASGSNSRKFFVGGNWKCNGNKTTIAELCSGLSQGVKFDNKSVEVVCAPPAVYLQYAREKLRPEFALAGQNCWVGKSGAFTGELEAGMLKDVGAEWVILGHSERRHLPQIRETDEFIAAKTRAALDAGVKVIFCVGETREEREAGQTEAVCVRQLKPLLTGKLSWNDVVIAYEPVWAIGTGLVASPQQAQDVHNYLRKWISSNISSEVGSSIRIIYGGSVTEKNCNDLSRQNDIDGFLVGGASLKAVPFLQIVDAHKTRQ